MNNNFEIATEINGWELIENKFFQTKDIPKLTYARKLFTKAGFETWCFIQIFGVYHFKLCGKIVSLPAYTKERINEIVKYFDHVTLTELKEKKPNDWQKTSLLHLFEADFLNYDWEIKEISSREEAYDLLQKYISEGGIIANACTDIMNRKDIVLLVGESGCGKTTVSNILKEKYGWSDISSYTTRPARYEGEKGHIFITEEEFEQIQPKDMCAFTVFNGYCYCATHAQADNADVYVVDPKGIYNFMKYYKGRRRPLICYLKTSDMTRIERMRQRGDDDQMVLERIEHDRRAFVEYQDPDRYLTPPEISCPVVTIPCDQNEPAEIADIIYGYCNQQ